MGNNGPRPLPSNSGFNPGFKPSNGSTLKGHNTYKNNNGYKARNYNSSGFRQNTNTGWSGNTETGLYTVIECQICNKMGHTTADYFHWNTSSLASGFMV